MNLVVAVDRNWAIGKGGKLLIHNKYDLEHFKALTIGKTVVYGRKTLETFPGKKPLKERTNLVLTHDQNYVVDGATVIHDLSELENYPSDDIYVIGGASLYDQLFDKCKYAFVTHFEYADPDADAFFPNLAEKKNWEILEETPTVTYDGVKMRFVTYRNLDFFPKPKKDVD